MLNKEILIGLTNNLYRLTLLFPKKEPLRYKMRELADDILAKFAEAGPPQAQEELEVLDSYFEVAKAQNWVSASEILAIQKEYANLREELKKVEPERKQEEAKENPFVEAQLQPSSSQSMSERQEKILDFLDRKSVV